LEVQVVGTYAYLAHAQGGLLIADVSTPSNPTIAGHFNPSGVDFRDLEIVGDYVYLTDGALWIVDVSEPTTPTVKSTYYSGGVSGVAVKGNHAYVTLGVFGLRVVDITDVTAPQEVGFIQWRHLPGYDGNTVDVEVVGHYAFVADSMGGVRAVDVSNPFTPTQVAHYDTPGLDVRKVAVAGNHVYVSAGTGGLVILQFSELLPGPFLDLPFDHLTRGSGGGFAGVFFRGEFLKQTTSIFDHQEPLDQDDDYVVSYLGTNLHNPLDEWPDDVVCGDPTYGNLGCYDGHEGYDFKPITATTDVYAAASGIVTQAGDQGCYGEGVRIDHGNGVETLYGHLREGSIPLSVTVGITVTGNTKIGEMGCSIGNNCGVCTSEHLHFGVYYNGVHADPSGWQDAGIADPCLSSSGCTPAGQLWRHTPPGSGLWSVDGNNGGMFTSGNITVTVAPGAFSGVLSFTLTAAPVSYPSAHLKPTGNSFALNAGQSQLSINAEVLEGEPDSGMRASQAPTLTTPITIAVSYLDAQVGDLDERTLNLYRWDDQASIWAPLGTTFDISGNLLVARTDSFGLFALLVDDDDVLGPHIGQPTYSSTVASDQWLTITVPISDTLAGNHGVSEADLKYSYNVPYTQTAVHGVRPNNSGNGIWTFVLPPQGYAVEGRTLSFSIAATDGDLTRETTINDNNGSYFTVMVERRYRVYLPITQRTD
jgi:murein DD-endopeptidase MepM/ murein hydrolase activator NlpD